MSQLQRNIFLLIDGLITEEIKAALIVFMELRGFSQILSYDIIIKNL